MGLQGVDLEGSKARSRKNTTKAHNAILQHYQTLSKKAHAFEGRSDPILNLKSHHAWITMYLIQKFTKGGDHILDLACGKGGDLIKWEKAKVGSYVGVDMVECLLEQAKQRYAKSGCTFSAKFLCGDGFGSMLLQSLGLTSQGNHHETLFLEKFGLRNQSHNESLFFEGLKLQNQGLHENVLFEEHGLINQDLQEGMFLQESTLLENVLYDSLSLHKLSLKNSSKCHKTFLLQKFSRCNHNHLEIISLFLDKALKNEGFFESYGLRITAKDPYGSLVEGNQLGLTHDSHYETFMQSCDPSNKRKETYLSLRLEENMEMNKVKGVQQILEIVDEDLHGDNMVKLQGEGPLSKTEKQGKFDVCSCQFALHYAWSSEDRAREAIKNVAKVLKTGGYFIGTIPDAQVILRKLQRVATNKANLLQKMSKDCAGFHFGNKVYNVNFDDVNVMRALSLPMEITRNQLSQLKATMCDIKKPSTTTLVRNCHLGRNNIANIPSIGSPICQMKVVKKSICKPPRFLRSQVLSTNSTKEKEMRENHLATTSINCFGIEYEFHLEGAVEHCPEWLVPFHSLMSLANQYGLELVFITNFEELLSTQRSHEQVLLSQKQPNNKQEFMVINNPLPEGIPSLDELECMSLYLAFAFRKRAITC